MDSFQEEALGTYPGLNKEPRMARGIPLNPRFTGSLFDPPEPLIPSLASAAALKKTPPVAGSYAIERFKLPKDLEVPPESMLKEGDFMEFDLEKIPPYRDYPQKILENIPPELLACEGEEAYVFTPLVKLKKEVEPKSAAGEKPVEKKADEIAAKKAEEIIAKEKEVIKEIAAALPKKHEPGILDAAVAKLHVQNATQNAKPKSKEIKNERERVGAAAASVSTSIKKTENVSQKPKSQEGKRLEDLKIMEDDAMVAYAKELEEAQKKLTTALSGSHSPIPRMPKDKDKKFQENLPFGAKPQRDHIAENIATAGSRVAIEKQRHQTPTGKDHHAPPTPTPRSKSKDRKTPPPPNPKPGKKSVPTAGSPSSQK